MTTIITIDGPSGVGKGTISGLLAEKYGFHLLDSGALYRLTGVNAVRLGLDPENADDAARAVADLDVAFTDGKAYLHGEDVSADIRTEKAGIHASKVAVHPIVRDKLFAFMQDFVRSPGIVADGRDMGTAVFPQADLKLFLTAAPDVRAKRRHQQLLDSGKPADYDSVFNDLAARDQRDSERAASPLAAAEDAIHIDTGEMPIDAVFQAVEAKLRERDLLPSADG